MAGKTDALEVSTLDANLVTGTQYFMALHTADPGDTGAATNELPAANGYARTAITFAAADANGKTHGADVQFPNPTADWPEATHFSICTAGVQGVADLRYTGLLVDADGVTPAPLTALANKPIKFAAGTIVVTED